MTQHENVTDQQRQSAEELEGNTGAGQHSLTGENLQFPPSNGITSAD